MVCVCISSYQKTPVHNILAKKQKVYFDFLEMLQRSKLKNASLILSPLFSRTMLKLWYEENIEWVVYFQKPLDYGYFLQFLNPLMIFHLWIP